MRIVVNALSATLGGGQTYLRNLFAHLPERDDVQVLVFAAPALKLPPHPRVRVCHPRWPTANPLLRALWERFALPARLRREGAEVLFCPGGVVATRAPASCRVVTMFRNMIPFDAALMARMPWGLQRLRNLILRRVMLRSMAEADLTIFISAHARALIESQIRIRHAVTIAHGIGEAFRTHGKPLARPAAAPAGEYLLYVSRFDLYKHHAELVSAYAALPQGVRRKHPLLLLGETNLPDAAHVLRLVDELGVQQEVFIPGAVAHAELPAYYAQAHAVLFASSCENCPNILLESLGAGRPVLCSDVMPMPEFGGPGLIYFSPFDPASIAQALNTLLQDPQRAQEAAAAALQRSRAYDWARSASETWRHLFALADTPASARAGIGAGAGPAD